MISIVLVSTMGFSVNTLYCYCTGQYETSLANIEHHCTKIQEDEDLSKLHPCCRKARLAACEKMKKEHDEKDCTKREKKFCKADLKFLEITKTEVPQPSFVWVKSLKITPTYFSIAKIQNLKSEIPTRPPPQYFGRFLLNFIQVYRC